MQEPGGCGPSSCMILSPADEGKLGKGEDPGVGSLYSHAVCQPWRQSSLLELPGSALEGPGGRPLRTELPLPFSTRAAQRVDKAYSPHNTVLEGPRAGRPTTGSRHSLTYNPHVYKACTWTYTINGHRHKYMEMGLCSQTHTRGHIRRAIQLGSHACAF